MWNRSTAAYLLHYSHLFLLYILQHALDLDVVNQHSRALVTQYCHRRHVFDLEVIQFQNSFVVLIIDSENYHFLESSDSLYILSCLQRVDCVWFACQCYYLRCAHLMHSFRLLILFDSRHYFHLSAWLALWRRLLDDFSSHLLRNNCETSCYFGSGVCSLSVFPLSIYFFQPISWFLQPLHQCADVAALRRRGSFAGPPRQLLYQDEQFAQFRHWNHSGRVFLLRFIEFAYSLPLHRHIRCVRFGLCHVWAYWVRPFHSSASRRLRPPDHDGRDGSQASLPAVFSLVSLVSYWFY